MLSEPLPYHLKIRDYFKRQSGIWSFFSADRKKEEQLTAFKTDLLKNTYQFQPGSDPLLYEKINIIKEKLGLGHLPVTAYQAAHSSELNASIVCLFTEAHMVFSGGVLQLLDEQELSALIAHELAHIKLYSLLNGELEISDRIITVLANSPDSEASHYETARLFRRYTEIYCDRVAYGVLGEPGPVITMLLKMATGLTHPENFIRTRALHLWHEQEILGRSGGGARAGAGSDVEGETPAKAGEGGSVMGTEKSAEAAITQMIEGVMELDRLDVLAQKELTELTHALLAWYLQPEWFRTPVVVALARQYFSDPEVGRKTGGEWDVDERAVREKLKTFLAGAHPSIREYFAYVLLDFALADQDLEDVPLGHALHLAETLGLTPVFEPMIKKELTYSDKQWDRVKLSIPRQ